MTRPDRGVTARKSVDDIVRRSEAGGEGGKRLQRSLGVFSITAIGIGAIVGAGIFVLTGTAAARYAGPGIMLSFVMGGVVCALVGLCYAELAAMMPVSGSTYTYTYATLGEIFAWMIGWDLVLEYGMGAATVAVGWSGYAVSILHSLGIDLPPGLTVGPWAKVEVSGAGEQSGIVNLPAVVIVALLTAMLVFGTQLSTRLNNVMVAIKLVVVAAFIGVGAFFVSPGHWHPFIPDNAGEFGHFGLSGVLRGSAVVFFAYIGFDAVSTAAQEARQPQRDMPRGILGSVVICTLLYLVVSAVMTGVVPYDQLNVPDPIAKAVDVIGFGWFALMVKSGALAGLTTVILVSLFGQSRVFFTMAEDGLLPGLFARVHPRRKTPYFSQILIGAVVAVVAAVVPAEVLAEMVSIGTLFAFALVCGAVLYLRRTDPGAERPFRVPGVPIVPVLGIVCSVALMAGLPGVTWLRLLAWMVLGLAVYFCYGRRHSVLRHGAVAER